MATNIPPLVSSSPPPLCETDEEEDDDDSQFGIFATAEDLDYTGCIPCQTNVSKIDAPTSDVTTQQNKEHDCTSQDSTTDSGLCPDSEGMSPTPHSDEERTDVVKLCTNERLGHSLANAEYKTCNSLSTTIEDCVEIQLEDWSEPGKLTNGQWNSDASENFGSFECCSYNNKHFSENGISESQNELNSSELKVFSSINVSEESRIQESSEDILAEDEVGLQSENTGESSNQLNKANQVADLLLDPVCINGSDENTLSKDSFQHACDSDVDNFGDFQFEIGDKMHLDTPVHSPLESNAGSELKLDLVSRIEEEQNGLSENKIRPSSVESCDDSFDDFKFELENPAFGNLQQEEESGQVSSLALEPSGIAEEDSADQFSDFQFETNLAQSDIRTNVQVIEPSVADDESEDFGEFADFASSTSIPNEEIEASECLSARASSFPNVGEQFDQKTESFQFSDADSWCELFPAEVNTAESSASASISVEENTLWKKLFPIEASPALSYQWNQSCANKKLLSSLNIDSRNILCMPWCNMSVPRFAANLGFGPLEPVRASEPIQPYVNSASVFLPTSEDSVPDAHFDWVSSGLTNPLDSTETSTVPNKSLSAEAERIVRALPNLSYMKKIYLEFATTKDQ